jgi:ABC-type transport system substrate-binding protein
MASLVDPSGQYHHRRATGLFPPGLPGYDADLRKTQVSAEEARRILAEAGFPGGENLPELILAWPRRDSSTARDLAAILESLGIPAKYSVLKDEDFRDAVRSGEVDIFRQGWIADYPDPENFLQVFYSKSPINVGGYRNEEFDRLYESLRLETDEPSREALARTMERILIDDAAAIFLRHESQTQFVAAWVENWEGNCSNPLNVHYYERVRIDAGKRREYR